YTAPQADAPESGPSASVEPEAELEQPPAPSTSSPPPSTSRSSNIAVTADRGFEDPSAGSSSQHDHALLHLSPGDGGDGDGSAQQHTRSSTSEGYVLDGEVQQQSQAASLIMPESPTASAAPPLSTSTQPTATDTTAEARPQHAPTDEPPPLLPVQVFTPLFAALLLSPNNTLSDGSRAAVVELLRRLKDGFGLPQPPTGPGPGGTHISLRSDEMEDGGVGFPFGRWQRNLLERELIMGLAIGMARMDEEGRNFVVLSTDGNGEDLGLHDLGCGEEPIPQVTDDGLAGAEDGQGEQSSSGVHGEGAEIGLGLVSPVASDTATVVQDEGERGVTPQSLFDEEEAPRVQLPEPATVEPQSATDVNRADEARSSPSLVVITPPTVTSPSPPPPPSDVTPPSASTPSPASGGSNSPLSPVAPISATAHLTYLSPAHSRSGSPVRQSRSPAGSAPHTPPSPTIRPVRLPSTESTRSVRIPGTPMEVIEHEDVLGLDTDAVLTPLVQEEIPAPVATVAGGFLGIPLVQEP
ncbi:hypothetical protein FRC00_014683, partial [Tulasnella sp. 408]